jgi:hypothetical protein
MGSSASSVAAPPPIRPAGPATAAVAAGRLSQTDAQLNPRDLAAKLSVVQGTLPYQHQEQVSSPHIHAPHLQPLASFTEPGALAEEFERCLVLLAGGQVSSKLRHQMSS